MVVNFVSKTLCFIRKILVVFLPKCIMSIRVDIFFSKIKGLGIKIMALSNKDQLGDHLQNLKENQVVLGCHAL